MRSFYLRPFRRFTALGTQIQALWHLLQTFSTWIFSSWGKIAFYYPYWIIGVSVLTAFFLGLGLTPGYAEWVYGADRLYALPHSVAREQDHIHASLFPEARARASCLLVVPATPNRNRHNAVLSKEGGRNVLTREFVQLLSQIDQLILGHAVDSLTRLRVSIPDPQFADEKRQLVFRDLCLKEPTRQAECAPASLGLITLLQGALKLPPPMTVISNTSDTGSFVSDPESIELPLIDGFLVDFMRKRLIPADLFLGKIRTRPCVIPVSQQILREFKERRIPNTTLRLDDVVLDPHRMQLEMRCVTSAEAVLVVYNLRQTASTQSAAEAWEGLLTEIFHSRERWGPANVYLNAFRNRDDALRASTAESDDVLLVVLTFMALAFYTGAVNFSCDMYRNRVIPALCGVLSASLGLVAGIGLCCHLGLRLVPTAFVCPFLILGVGVDNAFILINRLTLNTALLYSPEKRCRRSLEETGAGITITTATSLIAFAVGTGSPYTSIRNFCLFCGTSLAMTYVFCFTFFFPILCLDADREAQQRTVFRLPISFCLKRPKKGNASQSPLSWDAPDFLKHGIVDPPGNVGRRWRLFIQDSYAPVLMKPVSKTLILMCFFGLFVVSVVGMAHLELGLQLSDLTPYQSALRAFDTHYAEAFQVYDMPTDVVFLSKSTPWWSMQFLLLLQRFDRALVQNGLALRVINPLLLIAGDPQYRAGILSGKEAIFEKTLRSALTRSKGLYKSFAGHFVWEGHRLRAWRLTILPPAFPPPASSQERAQFMVRIRQLCTRHSAFAVPASYSEPAGDVFVGPRLNVYQTHTFPWNPMMVYYESDLRIVYAVVTEIATAGIALAVVAVLGFPSWTSGVIVVSTMILIDISVVGFMYFCSVKLNMISMVCLLLSIGFSVDYSTHIVHAFSECSEARSSEEQATKMLTTTGNAVFHGAVASFLGITVLAFSRSYILNVFFKMMGLVIAFGAAYGLIFLPVVLSIIGAPATSRQRGHSSYADSERNDAGNATTYNCPSSLLTHGRQTGNADSCVQKKRANFHPHLRLEFDSDASSCSRLVACERSHSLDASICKRSPETCYQAQRSLLNWKSELQLNDDPLVYSSRTVSSTEQLWRAAGWTYRHQLTRCDRSYLETFDCDSRQNSFSPRTQAPQISYRRSRSDTETSIRYGA